MSLSTRGRATRNGGPSFIGADPAAVLHYLCKKCEKKLTAQAVSDKIRTRKRTTKQREQGKGARIWQNIIS